MRNSYNLHIDAPKRGPAVLTLPRSNIALLHHDARSSPPKPLGPNRNWARADSAVPSSVVGMRSLRFKRPANQEAKPVPPL